MEKTGVRKIKAIFEAYFGVELNSNEAKKMFIDQDWEMNQSDNGSKWLTEKGEKESMYDYLVALADYKVLVQQHETCQDFVIDITLPCGPILNVISVKPLI